jgi:hypothetical protein
MEKKKNFEIKQKLNCSRVKGSQRIGMQIFKHLSAKIVPYRVADFQVVKLKTDSFQYLKIKTTHPSTTACTL